MLDFKDYKDPERAKRIWDSYKQDIESLGVYQEASTIYDLCDNADSLDLRLDLLIDIRKKSRFNNPRRDKFHEDLDGVGGWGNIIRALDE